MLNIIAADGAADFLFRHKIIPDSITGDFDSISTDTLRYFKTKKVTINKVADQNSNDLEKAIRLSQLMKMKKIFVIGYGGRRIDHTLNNFSILKKYYGKAEIHFIDDTFEIFFSAKPVKFSYKKNETLSIFALDEKVRVTTEGLKYNLKNETLQFGVREGALNSTSSTNINLNVTKGTLLIFKKHFGEIGKLISS